MRYGGSFLLFSSHFSTLFALIVLQSGLKVECGCVLSIHTISYIRYGTSGLERG